MKQTTKNLPLQHAFTDEPVQLIPLNGFNSPASFLPHRHSFYMLLWITKGRGFHRINYREYEQKPGQVYLLHDGDIHQVIQYPEDGWMILFKSSVYDKFQQQYQDHQHIGLCDQCSRTPYLNIDEKSVNAFQTLFSLTQQEFDLNSKSALLPHYISLMLFHLNRHFLPDANLHYSSEARQIRKLKQLINLHYKEHRYADFYGNQLGISARKTNEICKRATGRLVHELVTERLLSACEALLGGTDMQVKEIIYELGFIDHSHFAYFFRQNKGTTPSDYRKKLQG